MRWKFGTFTYHTTDVKVEIKTGDFIIQENGGNFKPIVRKVVEDELNYKQIRATFEQTGYYPIDKQRTSVFGNKFYKIIKSNNPLILINNDKIKK